MSKALVGMSGGVDSSIAAYLLKKAGYEVEGISLRLFDSGGRGSCCSIETIESAALTARRLSIPHSVLDAREAFGLKVVRPFVESYSRGLTPNPCILCNAYVKFPLLLEDARRRGIEFIATGHYARIERVDGTDILKAGVDKGKDQSYVLYCLDDEVFASLLLPLGGYMKEEVRGMAHELGLPSATRPESQEICFIGEGRYEDFIGGSIAGAPGPILDESKRRIGTHKGIYRYTIGQRKGLGISSPNPLYVTGIDVAGNAVYVGPREAAMSREFRAGNLRWLQRAGHEFRASVKVRSMMEAATAAVEKVGDMVHVLFDEPQWAPAPGQSAVFYDGDAVIGGGIIAS